MSFKLSLGNHIVLTKRLTLYKTTHEFASLCTQHGKLDEKDNKVFREAAINIIHKVENNDNESNTFTLFSFLRDVNPKLAKKRNWFLKFSHYTSQSYYDKHQQKPQKQLNPLTPKRSFVNVFCEKDRPFLFECLNKFKVICK